MDWWRSRYLFIYYLPPSADEGVQSAYLDDNLRIIVHRIVVYLFCLLDRVDGQVDQILKRITRCLTSVSLQSTAVAAVDKRYYLGSIIMN